MKELSFAILIFICLALMALCGCSALNTCYGPNGQTWQCTPEDLRNSYEAGQSVGDYLAPGPNNTTIIMNNSSGTLTPTKGKK